MYLTWLVKTFNKTIYFKPLTNLLYIHILNYLVLIWNNRNLSSFIIVIISLVLVRN